MTVPWRGLFWGTMMRRCASPAALTRARTVSSSLRPPSVSFATTRISVIGGSFPGRHRDAAGGTRPDLGATAEDAVHRAGHAVLVRPADDRRGRVEVEDRRRRRDLPLERQRAPRVRDRARTAAPARDHV